MALVNPSNGRIKNWSWASGGCSILAEIGTLHLEYSELTHQFKDQSYLDKVMKVRDILKGMPRPGMWLNFIQCICISNTNEVILYEVHSRDLIYCTPFVLNNFSIEPIFK